MPLTPGLRLGPYEVVARIGAGGMGEVYRARDTRLAREVALKVLPDGLVRDAHRRERLEREAKAISAFNHPHACALFDVGRAELEGGPVDFLVMELVEGETLADRLARGPLPPQQVVTLGAQLAEALAAAHARGIVHRDLKPSNVMLTRTGAKLLDFGLARSDAERPIPASDASELTESLPMPLTREGTVVGTWPYLSPEQLAGRPADARSDVFALGAVLFEMLTAVRAFPGSTLAEVQAAIRDERVPDLRAHGPALSEPLAGVVRQCLAREPHARWQSAADVAHALRLVATPDASAVPATRGRWPWLVAAAGFVVAALALTGVIDGRRASEPLALRFVVQPPQDVLLPRPTQGLPIAVSPDGRRLVFTAREAGARQGLWIWTAEDGRLRPLEGTEGAMGPFFSPDSREVAFFADDELRRVPASGGPATRIARSSSGNGGSWSRDGTILFVRWSTPGSGLWQVPAAGGEPRQVHAATRGRGVRSFPAILPDGRHYLYLSEGMGGFVGTRSVCVGALAGGEPACLGACDSAPAYSATGHVVCVRRGALVALPFDAGRRATTGEAVVVAPAVRWLGASGTASFAVAANGTLLVHEPASQPSQLAWLDRNGRRLGGLGDPARYGQLALSRDGRRVVTEIWNQDLGSRDLWTFEVATGVPTRLTIDPLDAPSPVWSPDGERIAYGRATGELLDLAVLRLDGGGVKTILAAPGVQLPKAWSPDGRLIAYEDYRPGRRDQRQLWLATLDGAQRRFHDRPANVHSPAFSADSRMLAFVSDESGREEVYLGAVEGGAPPRRVSRAGGLIPRFRRDGRELLFFQPDGMMVSVDPAVAGAPPRPLFPVEGVTAFDFDFDVAPDGQRFLVRIAPQPEGSLGLWAALHWTQGLTGAR